MAASFFSKSHGEDGTGGVVTDPGKGPDLFLSLRHGASVAFFHEQSRFVQISGATVVAEACTGEAHLPRPPLPGLRW